MSSIPDRRYTVEEYLALKRISEVKHEYHNGRIVPLHRDPEFKPESILCHTIIIANLVRELGLRLERCLVLPRALRVESPAGTHVNPDVAVVCDEPQMAGARQETLLNPDIVFEVLSPSTESYDRDEKFQFYSSIPSVKEYILVAQDCASISHYVRQDASHNWLCDFPRGRKSLLSLSSVNCSIPVKLIYQHVKFPAPSFGTFIDDEEDS